MWKRERRERLPESLISPRFSPRDSGRLVTGLPIGSGTFFAAWKIDPKQKVASMSRFRDFFFFFTFLACNPPLPSLPIPTFKIETCPGFLSPPHPILPTRLRDPRPTWEQPCNVPSGRTVALLDKNKEGREKKTRTQRNKNGEEKAKPKPNNMIATCHRNTRTHAHRNPASSAQSPNASGHDPSSPSSSVLQSQMFLDSLSHWGAIRSCHHKHARLGRCDPHASPGKNPRCP